LEIINMADTLESIFHSTSIGGTQLDDGEHTILTTDSSTSFVIKDMHVNGTSTLANTHLELNGFNVSSITANATGSLIIPPSSTLKIKTTDYPFSFVEQKDMMGLSNTSSIMMKTYLNPDGTQASGISKQFYYTMSSTSNDSEIIDMEHGKSSHDNKVYVFYSQHDMNSSQVLAATESTGYNHSNTNHQVSSGSYDPFGFGYNSTYGKIAVQFNNGTLRYWPLDSSYTTPSANLSPVSPSNFGSGNRANGSYNYTRSSYPYMVGGHNFIWYWRGSSYMNEMWAINLENGQDFFLNLQADATPHYSFSVGDDSNHMVVSYRPSDDRFIVWWATGTSTIRYAVINQTATQMRAVNQSSYSTINKLQSGQFSTPSNDMKSTYRNSNVLGFDFNGNLLYHNTANGVTAVGTDGAEIASGALPATRDFGGTNYTDDNRINTRRFKRLTPSEMTANNLTSPSFGIQLLGVKSTV
jgi:hypothetical protein